jgi:hypothetical protein
MGLRRNKKTEEEDSNSIGTIISLFVYLHNVVSHVFSLSFAVCFRRWSKGTKKSAGATEILRQTGNVNDRISLSCGSNLQFDDLLISVLSPPIISLDSRLSLYFLG